MLYTDKFNLWYIPICLDDWIECQSTTNTNIKDKNNSKTGSFINNQKNQINKQPKLYNYKDENISSIQ